MATDMVESLKYKLRTFVVKLEGPTEIYYGKKSVVTNYSVPAPVLNITQYYMI